MTGPLGVDLAGTTLSRSERRRIADPRVGLVILFARNFVDSAQLRALTASIRAVRARAPLIAVDHEGGRVQRFRDSPFTVLPPMAALGRRWETDPLAGLRVAAACGYVMAAELRAHGVDLSFAPVLDLAYGRSAVIGDRALHRDPRVVALLAAQICHGMARAGMSNCGKHFPGHGWAAEDSHTELPVDRRALAAVLAEDAAVYRALASVLDGVMPAHVLYPAVDAMPAGMSPRWLVEILRGELGFTGAVFSDDLSMAGARAAGTVPEAAQRALAAGCDYVLVCNDPAQADAVLAQWRWQDSPTAAQRRARVRPRGRALALAALRRDPGYQRARADVLALTPAADPAGVAGTQARSM